MNDKIKDHIIQLIINDKEISGKEKAEILKELFDAHPCLREHYPQNPYPYPVYIPTPSPDNPPYPIIYTQPNIAGTADPPELRFKTWC